jgi:glycerate kinase
MPGRLLVAALPVAGIFEVTDATSLLARIIRSNNRSLASTDVVQFPIVDGGTGTIDFLVTHTLGSFLEVEASGASGEDVVVPIGFTGEDGKLAVIEMSRAARVSHPSDRGTTAGIGQLIQDALDEGAFSVMLGHEEPLACDAGLGAACALGMKFFDASGVEIDFARPAGDISPAARISQIEKVDATSRSFSLLSSRIYIARARMSGFTRNADHAANEESSKESKERTLFLDALSRLSEIIRRDTGIHPSTANLSASAIEFGLTAFLGAEVREGASLVLEASRISEAITRGEFSEFILLTPVMEDLENDFLSTLIDVARKNVKHRAILVTEGTRRTRISDDAPHDMHHSSKRDATSGEQEFYLQDVELFQTPISEASGIEEKRRDLTMRLEKLMPAVLDALRETSSAKAVTAKGSRA